VLVHVANPLSKARPTRDVVSMHALSLSTLEAAVGRPLSAALETERQAWGESRSAWDRFARNDRLIPPRIRIAEPRGHRAPSALRACQSHRPKRLVIAKDTQTRKITHAPPRVTVCCGDSQVLKTLTC
jgi:hypothetical protein